MKDLDTAEMNMDLPIVTMQQEQSFSVSYPLSNVFSLC